MTNHQLVFDLHSHSYFSDGILSPSDLVERAVEKGVNVLALTDHDETQGLSEATQKAQQLSCKLVQGVEISASWEKGKTVHIVGLNIDPDNQTLQEGLKSIREERIRRAKKIADKLHKAGVTNAWSDITEKCGFEAVTRTHFARYLVEIGAAKDIKQAFKKWLSRKGRAYVNGHWCDVETAVKWITSSGGQAIIAHPVRYSYSRKQLDKLIQGFKVVGGEGIEVVGSRYSEKEKAEMASLARRFELKSSVGSDFHGPDNPYVELGRNLELPVGTTPIWENWKIL